jgi:class 3 adenylate cyclase
MFADLRGFTAFAASAEPEEVVDVLHDWYELIGSHVAESAATVGYFAGDGVMLFWNDPLPADDPNATAIRVGLGLLRGIDDLNESWKNLGYTIGVGIGVASGYATIGMMGFKGRYDYTAIGPVVNLAARLSDEARDGRTLLVNQRTKAALGERLDCSEIEGGLELRGFPGVVATWRVHGLDGG